MRKPLIMLAVATLGLPALGLPALGCTSSSPSTSTRPGGGDDGSFCSLLIAFRAANDSLDIEVNSGDAGRVERAIGTLASQVTLLRQKAPSGIDADVTTVGAFIGNLQSFFAKYAYDLDAIVANTTATQEYGQLVTPEFEAAQGQLMTYAESTCGESVATSTTI